MWASVSTNVQLQPRPGQVRAQSATDETLVVRRPMRGTSWIWFFLASLASAKETTCGDFSQSLMDTSATNLECMIDALLLHAYTRREAYLKQVESWAESFDREASAQEVPDIESIYDDSYFDAMELQKKLP